MKQIQNHFLSELRIYSIRSLLLSLLIFSACPKKIEKEVFRTPPTPPWQTWGTESYGNLDFQQAVVSESKGELEVADKFYQLAYRSSDTEALKEEAFIRQLGTALKLGKSEQVLKQVSWYANETNQQNENLKPRIALIVAHAYLQRADFDQMLAWFATALRNSAGDPVFSKNILAQLEGQIRSISEADYANYEERWYPDQLIGPFFTRERMRRTQGGKPASASAVNWFSRETYEVNPGPVEGAGSQQIERRKAAQVESAEIIEEDLALSSSSGFVSKVAVLLPLSGEYSKFANQVLQGIKLALASDSIELMLYDTAGDPAKAAEACRKAVDDGAVVALGPLLVKTTEAVVKTCDSYGMPFISFSKQSGIPDLGRNIYRLGATVESQVASLLRYANRDLRLKRFGILHPKNPSGEQLASEFTKRVDLSTAVVLATASYVPGDMDSITQAVNAIEGAPVEAIFVADTLDSGFQALQMISESALLKNTQLIGPAYWDDETAMKGFAQLVDGAIYSSIFFVKSEEDRVRDFIEAYYDLYAQDPELLAAQGYDVAMMVREVLNLRTRAQSFSSDFNELQDYKGVTGELSVKENGEIEREASIIRVKRRGKLEEVHVP